MRSSDTPGTTNVACPICNASLFADFSHGLYRCVTCAAVLNPAVWEAGADARLQDEWFDDGAFDPRQSVWTRLFEDWNCNRTWRHLQERGIESGRLLEVGVGSGSLLAFMAARGFDVEGCDMARDVCAYVERTRRFRMHCGAVDEVEGKELFDVIVMNHVVEHVSDPIRLLKQATRLLRPGGILHIAVPNVAAWEARLSGWTSYLPYHLIYFNQASLEKAVVRAGLRPVEAFTHEPFSGWFLALLRTLTSRGEALRDHLPRKGKHSLEKSLFVEFPYRVAMLTVGGLTWPLRRLQAARGRGEELVMLASPPTRVLR